MHDGTVGIKLSSSVAGVISKLFNQVFVSLTQIILCNRLNPQRNFTEVLNQIRQQLINNAIPPQDLAEDMKKEIIDPLQAVTKTLMVDADRSVSRFRVAATSGKPASKLAAQSVKDVSNVISELKLILEKVNDMAEFHEIYQEGKYILEDLLKNWEETRELQKKRAIEKLKLLE